MKMNVITFQPPFGSLSSGIKFIDATITFVVTVIVILAGTRLYVDIGSNLAAARGASEDVSL
jgi:hypothetical protein